MKWITLGRISALKEGIERGFYSWNNSFLSYKWWVDKLPAKSRKACSAKWVPVATGMASNMTCWKELLLPSVTYPTSPRHWNFPALWGNPQKITFSPTIQTVTSSASTPLHKELESLYLHWLALIVAEPWRGLWKVGAKLGIWRVH